MPVDLLLVEGELDSAIMAALCAGRPTVEKAGSKLGLAAKILGLREHGRPKLNVFGLRDRDFDFDPPPLGEPCPWSRSRQGTQEHLGYYWSFHEIENYLLLPDLVDRRMAGSPRWDRSLYESELEQSARRIMFHEAAKWALGESKRPVARFMAAYSDWAEGALPSDLSEMACLGRAHDIVHQYTSHLSSQQVEGRFGAYRDRFARGDLSVYIQWFSGKDLLRAVGPWIQSNDFASNWAEWTHMLRDWVIGNPDEAKQAVPEWERVVALLRQID